MHRDRIRLDGDSKHSCYPRDQSFAQTRPSHRRLHLQSLSAAEECSAYHRKVARQGAFESIADCAVSWRVVGISEDALRKIATKGKRTDVRRGHWFARDQRYEALFGATAPFARPGCTDQVLL